MKRITLSLTILCLSLAAQPASACRYKPLSLEQKVAQADAIFEGKVTKSDEPAKDASTAEIHFEVMRWWKGRKTDGSAPSEIVLLTPTHTCGMSGLPVGSRMVVFAHGNPLGFSGPDGGFDTSTAYVKSNAVSRRELDALVEKLGQGQWVNRQ